MRTIFLIISIFFVLKMNAQEINSADPKVYLEKYQRQKKTGKIILIGSGGICATGLVLMAVSKKGEFLPQEPFWTGASLFLIGSATALSSIPFYISANHNKNKYLKLQPSVSFSNQNNEAQPIFGAKIQIEF